ncbi:exonuclease domain-containing protein [Corynebacterium incognita]|uniref:exonuclease domain-containing protein n=1 Tax=Corynebacterium incognita TaxID=2754725 RepID=UPI0031B62A15
MNANAMQVSVTATEVTITPSFLGASLGNAATSPIPVADITDIEVVHPTATLPGSLRVLRGGAPAITIPLAPSRSVDSELLDALEAARAGELTHDFGAAPTAIPSTAPDASTPVTGLNFVAVDVETANDNWGSVCQIGAVRFVAGIETEHRTWLCRPPAGLDSFAPHNVSIHGITAADVASAPEFATAFAEFRDFVGADALVAHNAKFDASALRYAARAAGAEVPTWTFICTLALAREASRSGVLSTRNHRLPTVAQALGFSLDSHHDAGADARAAGIIAAQLARVHGVEGSASELCTSRGFHTSTMSSDSVVPILAIYGESAVSRGATRAKKTGEQTQTKQNKAGQNKAGQKPGAAAPWQAVATPDAVPVTNEGADPNNPLFGHNVTLTGDFEPYDKGQLWDLIASRGATVGKNVTKKTTVLVTGTWATKTSKEKRAEELRDKGQEIQIWPAAQLYSAVGLDEQPPF